MRIIVIAGAVALLGVLLVAFYLRARPAVAEPESAAGDPAEASAALRASLLNGSASEFSIEPISSIWGVLMETGYPEAAATVVSLADGSASIYFSSGGGTIGGGSHDTVAAASRRVVILSKSHLSSMAKTSQYPPTQARPCQVLRPHDERGLYYGGGGRDSGRGRPFSVAAVLRLTRRHYRPPSSTRSRGIVGGQGYSSSRTAV